MLSRFCELEKELIFFFTSEESKLADLLSDETWCNKVAFLTGNFQVLNTLNNSIQGKNENILICTDKINFLRKS
jgi:hypothetical protein